VQNKRRRTRDNLKPYGPKHGNLHRVSSGYNPNIRSGTIKEAIDAGDKIVEEILRDGAQKLGTVLAGAVNMLAPDVIVLGGGLVEALPRLFLEEVGKAVAARVMPSYLRTYELKVAKLGDDAGAMGAAGLRHEAIDHAVEYDPVVEALADELLDMSDVVWREIGAHANDDRALRRLECEGVAFIRHGGLLGVA
jgi:hypothetical protein